jgi:PIN domain nuclease of toxin-antitoxin system
VNLLLDTHIWLWSHAEPDRLSRRVAGALADDLNQLWLSPISIWEFLRLTERGRVRVRGGTPPAEWVEAALSRAPMHDAALTREVAVRSRSVRLDHEDPADRFLAATADVYELTPVTADDRLLRGKGFRTLANRCATAPAGGARRRGRARRGGSARVSASPARAPGASR